jgi:hypothetical protein
VIAGLLLAVLPLQENRAWFLEVEVRGDCEAVRFDCGPDGDTLLVGPFGPREERRVRVPVPVRSPLGVEGLAAVPVPRPEILPDGAAADVRVVGWTQPQPCESLGAKLATPRLRPPVGRAVVRLRAPELALALASGVLLVGLRRRPAWSAGFGLLAGVVLGLLARGRGPVRVSLDVLEWRASDDVALRTRGAHGQLELAGAALEVDPPGGPISITWEARGTGTARAGAGLFTLALARPPDLGRRANDAMPLRAVWTRSREGAWTERGPWARGDALPSGRPGVPPGWIASGLPPGEGVLVAEGRESWLRCLGFEE